MAVELRTGLSLGANYEEYTFRATHLWQELVLSFRLTMPRCRHRLKMRWYEDSFTGREAVEWLHSHLERSGQFGQVNRDQAFKLLQKFLSSQVITEVRGKTCDFEEDSNYLYKFVTEPGPFNFVEEQTPAAKRGRANSLLLEPPASGYDGACFVNQYASAGVSPTRPGISPLKKSRSENCIGRHLAVRDTNTGQSTKPLTQSQVASTWKEVTLTRLLRLVDLPSLDGVLDHDAVDGKLIQCNASVSGRGLLGKAAAKFRRSVKPHDKKPPLPSHLHTLTTTHHHTRRFSTKIANDTQSSTHSESVSDVPQWVALAMKSLSKWPAGGTDELVGDQPVYGGLEHDVMQSLVHYYQSLTEPLISVKLYDLLMSIHTVLTEGRPGVSDALQLTTLLLPQTNRTRLHRMLRFIYKSTTNPQLVLSRGERNREVLLREFASVVIRSNSKLSRVDLEERRKVEKLVTFMAQNYQTIFEVPGDLKKQVQRKLDALSAGKEDVVPSTETVYCSRVSSQQYQTETQTSSQQALLGLLDTLLADQGMRDKDKKQRLKDFQAAYPELYAQRVPTVGVASKPRRHASFHCRTRPRHLVVNGRSDSSETLNTVNFIN